MIDMSFKGEDQYEEEIILWGIKFIDTLITKYRKGKKEHGSLPIHVLCAREVGQECQDIINYFAIDKVNSRIREDKLF